MSWKVTDVTDAGAATIEFVERHNAHRHYEAVRASPLTMFAVVQNGLGVSEAAYVSEAALRLANVHDGKGST